MSDGLVRSWGKRTVERLPKSLSWLVRHAYHRLQIRTGRFVSEEPDLALALAFLEEGHWVLDVGANVGHFTLPLGRHVGPNGRVVAVEPVLESFGFLCANVASAGLRNVTLLNLAASSAFRIAPMRIPRTTRGRPNLYQARVMDSSPTEDGVQVLCAPLDFLSNCPRVRLVKIDAEGHEWDVLAGLTELLRRHRPLLIVEASQGHRHPILDTLGYRDLVLPNSPNILYATPDDMGTLERTVRELRLCS